MRGRVLTPRLLLLAFLLASCIGPPPPELPLQATPAANIPINIPTATAGPPRPTATPTPPGSIKVGGLFDLTGPTSEEALPYVEAIRRHVRFVNGRGGTHGRAIELVEMDYAGKVPLAVDAYKELLRQRVVAILGWSSADTEALSPMLGEDRMPFLSASYSEILVEDLANRPYNFVIGPTYSAQMRSLLKYLSDTWPEKARKPSAAFLFEDNPLGRSPISTGRGMAGQLQIEVADEQAIPAAVDDATPYLYSIKNKKADFVVVSTMAASGAVVARDAMKSELSARLYYLSWAVDEALIENAKGLADRVWGVTPFAFLGEGQPGFADLGAAYAAAGGDPDALTGRHIQGWITAQLLMEGIDRASGRTDGEAIRAGLESIKDYSTGGILPPITWARDEHVGNKLMRLYQVQAGAWTPVTEYFKAE